MNQPSYIDNPWATNGTKTTIPATQATPGDGSASWDKGFPPETAIPISQGGVPPRYVDFNGVFYSLSSFAWWQQRGGLFSYSNTIDYPVGAIVISGGKTYQCLAENGPGTTAGVKAVTNTTYWTIVETVSGSTLNAANSGYIRYASGLQIVWDRLDITDADTGKDVTFPQAFSKVPVIVLTPSPQSAASGTNSVIAYPRTATGMTVYMNKDNVHNAGGFNYIAIGPWA